MKEPEPLYDVFEEDDKVLVVAEIPSADVQDIGIIAAPMTLKISVKGKSRHIKLPCLISPSSGQAEFRNGVLEVHLKKTSKREKEASLIIIN